MKASNGPAPDKGEAELRGTVTEKRVGLGSKSEHKAVYLQTDEGDYRLRRAGGNPFADPELKKWIGERVVATGMVSGELLVARDIKKE